jgi:hypothetical protein
MVVKYERARIARLRQARRQRTQSRPPARTLAADSEVAFPDQTRAQACTTGCGANVFA